MRHFITAQNTACGAHAPHKILAAALHVARDAARGGGSALHAARDAARGGGSALHTARDAACGGSSAPPPQHGILPAAFGQYPNSTASSTQSIRIGFAMILRRPYGAESSRRPRFAGHQPCMHLHPANHQIKNPAGTQTDPGRSADAEYVAGRAAWRRRQQYPGGAIASAVPARPRPRQQHPRDAITSVAPARPRPRPRGLKALTARRCRRS